MTKVNVCTKNTFTVTKDTEQQVKALCVAVVLLFCPVAVLQGSPGGWAVETVGGTLSGDKEANLTSPSDAYVLLSMRSWWAQHHKTTGCRRLSRNIIHYVYVLNMKVFQIRNSTC